MPIEGTTESHEAEWGVTQEEVGLYPLARPGPRDIIQHGQMKEYSTASDGGQTI